MRVTTNSSLVFKCPIVKSGHLNANKKTHKTRFPSCFADHEAAPSIVRLFTGWVQRADQTPNGVISINLRAQSYSHNTTRKAIAWLVKHKLMLRVERGGGRGVRSRYLIRWSFQHPTLTQRRKIAMFSVNHPKHTNTIPPPNTRRKALKDSSHSRTDGPRKSNRKPLAWAMSQLRRELQDYDITRQRQKFILSGLGSALWRGLKRGAIKAGRQLGQVVHDIIGRLRDAMAIGNSMHSWCSFGGWAVRCVIDDQRAKQTRDEASARLIAQIRREKEEAQGSVTAFLTEVGAGSLREYIQQRCALSG